MLLASWISSCTTPISSDFKDEEPGLADDELMWSRRIPSHVSQISWDGGITRIDSLTILNYNAPFFRDVLPVIIRDLVSGKIPGYEDVESAVEKSASPGLKERFTKMNGGRQDYSPFTKVVEVSAFVKPGSGGFSSKTAYLRILWKDPAGKQPEKYFAVVDVQDLESPTYGITFGETSLSVYSILQLDAMFSYPVYIRSNEMEYSISSFEEAIYLNRMVRTGRWKEVRWLNGELNISGRLPASMRQPSLERFEGEFTFQKSDSTGTLKTLLLFPGENFLLTDWSNRSRSEKYYPYNDSSFFSASGEIIVLEIPEGDSLARTAIFYSGTDTLVGRRSDLL